MKTFKSFKLDSREMLSVHGGSAYMEIKGIKGEVQQDSGSQKKYVHAN